MTHLAPIAEPTNLSPWEKDKIRLSFDVWLAKKARKYHCADAQIIAALMEPHEAEAGHISPSNPYGVHTAPASRAAGPGAVPSPAGAEGDEDRQPIQAKASRGKTGTDMGSAPDGDVSRLSRAGEAPAAAGETIALGAAPAAPVSNQEPSVEAVRDGGAGEVRRAEGSQARLPSDRAENKPDAPAVIAGAPITEIGGRKLSVSSPPATAIEPEDRASGVGQAPVVVSTAVLKEVPGALPVIKNRPAPSDRGDGYPDNGEAKVLAASSEVPGTPAGTQAPPVDTHAPEPPAIVEAELTAVSTSDSPDPAPVGATAGEGGSDALSPSPRVERLEETLERMGLEPIVPGKRRKGMQDEVRRVQTEHPDWTVRQIAQEVGAREGYVTEALRRVGLSAAKARPRPQVALPKPRWYRGKKDWTWLTALQQHIVVANHDHPEWTQADIGRHVEADHPTVHATVKSLGLVLPKGKPGAKPKPKTWNPDSLAEGPSVDAAPEPHPEPETPPAEQISAAPGHSKPAKVSRGQVRGGPRAPMVDRVRDVGPYQSPPPPPPLHPRRAEELPNHRAGPVETEINDRYAGARRRLLGVGG